MYNYVSIYRIEININIIKRVYIFLIIVRIKSYSIWFSGNYN